MDREDDPREKKQEAPDRFIKADDFGLRAEMQDDFGDENDNSFTIATRYEAISTLGEGGMGTVYKAHDNRLERSVAVKTILPQRLAAREASRRFSREVRALARLNHPNILTVYDYVQDGDLLYRIMELSGRDRLEIMGRIGGLESLNRFKAAAFEILQAHKQPDCFHFPVRATLTLATKQHQNGLGSTF